MSSRLKYFPGTPGPTFAHRGVSWAGAVPGSGVTGEQVRGAGQGACALTGRG